MSLQAAVYAMRNRQLVVISHNVTVKKQFDQFITVNPNHHPIVNLAKESEEVISKSVFCHNGKVIHTNLFNVLTSQWLFKQLLARPTFTER